MLALITSEKGAVDWAHPRSGETEIVAKSRHP
jgi:hypothetical protein